MVFIVVYRLMGGSICLQVVWKQALYVWSGASQQESYFQVGQKLSEPEVIGGWGDPSTGICRRS